MSFQMVLLTIHSWVRWLVLLVALVAVVKYVVGLVGGGEFDGMARGLSAAFSGLIDLNVALGVIQLIAFWRAFAAAAGGFPRPQVEHMGVMLVAAVIAHLPNRWKGDPARVRYRNGLLVIVGVVVLIVLGVSVLQGSRWVFRGL
jgi:hypothetical protein